MMNLFSTLFGTDINRRLGDMLAQPCAVISDEPSFSRGMYLVVFQQRA
jgi:hypothetical protein